MKVANEVRSRIEHKLLTQHKCSKNTCFLATRSYAERPNCTKDHGSYLQCALYDKMISDYLGFVTAPANLFQLDTHCLLW